METLEWIEEYFKGDMPPADRQRFEDAVRQDPAFARDVAFYLSTGMAVAEIMSEEKKNRFRELEAQRQPVSGKIISMKRVWWAAAAVIVVIVVVYLGTSRTQVDRLADRFIEKKYSKIEATMGVEADFTQQGISAYNSSDFAAALNKFEAALRINPSDNKALEYAGVSALRMKEYDKALNHFRNLSKLPGLYENRGPFLQASTLLSRRAAGDRELAKPLLQEVVDKNLYGREQAQEWLQLMNK